MSDPKNWPKRKYTHKKDVKVKTVREFLDGDLFSCPGCMRKIRGTWRYCDKCEAKKNGV